MYLALLTVPLAKVTERFCSVSLMLVSRSLLPVIWFDAPESRTQSWSQLTAETPMAATDRWPLRQCLDRGLWGRCGGLAAHRSSS